MQGHELSLGTPDGPPEVFWPPQEVGHEAPTPKPVVESLLLLLQLSQLHLLLFLRLVLLLSPADPGVLVALLYILDCKMRRITLSDYQTMAIRL